MSTRDFVGILVAANDLVANPDGKGVALTIYNSQKNDYGVSQYANSLMVLDLKNKLAGDSVVNVHISPEN